MLICPCFSLKVCNAQRFLRAWTFQRLGLGIPRSACTKILTKASEAWMPVVKDYNVPISSVKPLLAHRDRRTSAPHLHMLLEKIRNEWYRFRNLLLTIIHIHVIRTVDDVH